MANDKYVNVDPSLKEFIGAIADNYDLDNYINMTVLSDEKQKEIGKVIKANPLVKHFSDNQAIIVINEPVFEKIGEGEEPQVRDALKTIIIDNVLTALHFDSEKDKLEIIKEDFKTYSGLLSKYGAAETIRLHESIVAAKEIIKENGVDGGLNELFDDIKKIFDEVMLNYNLTDNVGIFLSIDNKEKELGKYKKVDKHTVYKHSDEDDVDVTINQAIFEHLDDMQKLMAAEMVMSYIKFDDSKDSFEFKKPDFTIHSGVLMKYGADSCIAAHDAVKAAFTKKHEEEEEAKSNAKS